MQDADQSGYATAANQTITPMGPNSDNASFAPVAVEPEELKV